MANCAKMHLIASEGLGCRVWWWKWKGQSDLGERKDWVWDGRSEGGIHLVVGNEMVASSWVCATTKHEGFSCEERDYCSLLGG